MNKYTHILITFAFLAIPFFAKAFETGQTVRLVNQGKSVFVENSSLDESKNAVLWTETNVNAQRWTLTAKTNGTFLLSNDYTGFYLAGLTSSTTGYVGQMNKTTANSRGSWEFVPVEGTTNQYYLYLNTTRKYALAAPAEATDGGRLTIVNTTTATNVEAARLIWTVEIVEPMAQEFTKDKRDDMMAKWKARAYKQASTGYVIGGGGWWGDAEMFEIVLDALETTGDQQYATMFENLYTNFIARNGSTWYQKGVSGYNEFNDDIAWMCIACVRAYLLTGTTKYRSTAKTNFDGMFKRADCYGNDLLQWKHSSTGTGTNSCINGPAAVCACYLAIAQADDSYYEKAKKTYLAERNFLFEKSGEKITGKIWDSGDPTNNTFNYWASTYNQGTNLGAAIMLYNHYKDPMFKEDADAIIKWSEANMANSKGIIHVCQTVSGDLTNFKGIMLRYLRMYAETFNAPSHYAWIAKNAYHAWNNRNSSGITSSAWLYKAEEDFKHKEGDEYKNFGNDGNMTCVSAAFNCHLGAVDAHDAYAKNEAEDFNFVRNAPVTYSGNEDEDGGGKVGPMKSSNYIGYRRVDFGDKPASHIDLRAYINTTTAGINVYLDQPSASKGILLCNIKGSELPAIKSWGTIRKMINRPVMGVHNVYFVSSGTGTNINWWQFQSLNPVFADLTNGGGNLTTSIATTDASALTDDDITTAFNAGIEAGAETWIQYQSTSPMRLYGYQLFSGSDTAGNPKGWSLQASNDGKNWETLHTETGTTFSVQAERYSADVQTAKTYTHFRLLFSLGNTQTKFSLSEWQLLGRCIDDYDLTADGGTITEGCEALIDHVGTTLFPTPVTAVYRPGGNYTLSAYSITSDAIAQAPKSWKLEGSANGTTWKVIDQQTEATFPYDNCTNVYYVNPGTSYLYYRLTVNDSEALVSQWQLFGKLDFGTFYADVTSIADILACDGSDATNLTDDNGTTYATISGEKPFWDIYTPIAVKTLGFSILCGDNAELDPKNITLYGIDESGTKTQLSNKATNFPARGSRLTYTTSTTKLFKSFRLQINEAAGPNVCLADFELYGAALAEAGDNGFYAPTSFDASAEGLSSTELIGRINDGNRTTNYRAAFTEPVSITYTFDQPVGINTYGITASKNEPTRDPAAWVLEGSNDGSNWIQLDSRSGELFSQRYATQFYTTERAETYSNYRLTITASNGADQIQIGELQLLSIEKEDATEIRDIQTAKATQDVIYDLSGRQIVNSKLSNSKLPCGIYIINGKKVLIKF